MKYQLLHDLQSDFLERKASFHFYRFFLILTLVISTDGLWDDYLRLFLIGLGLFIHISIFSTPEDSRTEQQNDCLFSSCFCYLLLLAVALYRIMPFYPILL